MRFRIKVPARAGRRGRKARPGILQCAKQAPNRANCPDRRPWWNRLEERARYLSEGRRGQWGLFIAAVLESSVFPFPIELFLIPAFLAQRRRALLLATTALAGCVVAAAAFYVIGWLLYESVGAALAGFLNIQTRLQEFGEQMDGRGFWLIFTISLFPLPIQVATLGSGVFGYSFPLFLLAIISSRLVRFHGLALITLALGRGTERFFASRPPWWKAAALGASLLVLFLLSWLAVRAS